jgi:hypothetical protein
MYIGTDNWSVMYYRGFVYLKDKTLQHKAATGDIKPLWAIRDCEKSHTEKENYWTKNLH